MLGSGSAPYVRDAAPKAAMKSASAGFSLTATQRQAVSVAEADAAWKAGEALDGERAVSLALQRLEGKTGQH